MNRPAVGTAGLLVGLLLSGCGTPATGLDTSPARRSTPTAVAPAATASGPSSPGTETGTSATHPASCPRTGGDPSSQQSTRWATVALGKHATSAPAQAFARYSAARTRAVVTRTPSLPAFVALATPRWRAYHEREVFDVVERKGWTVDQPTRWVLRSVECSAPSAGGDATRATVLACVWGPSAAYREREGGRVAEAVEKRWYAYTLRLVTTGPAGWQVDDVVESTSSCKGAS